jgi:hypothetical protein
LRGNASLIVVVAAHLIDVVWFHIAPPGSLLRVVTAPKGCSGQDDDIWRDDVENMGDLLLALLFVRSPV